MDNLTEREAVGSFKRPYANAGHDVDAIFKYPYRCSRCRSYLIDLSEDLSYGDMRPCRDHLNDTLPIAKEPNDVQPQIRTKRLR